MRIHNKVATIYFCFIDYAKAFDCVDHNKLWKILKEMGIPDHLTCLMRNLYAGQEATVRIGHGTTDWVKIGKGVRGFILSKYDCLFNFYAELFFSHLVVSDSAAPWTAARQASLSLAISRACSNSCPWSQWCHPTISSSVVLFSYCLQSF